MEVVRRRSDLERLSRDGRKESQRVPLQLLNLISDNSPFPKVSSFLPCFSQPANLGSI
jgi:hypothetical protein